MHKQNREQNVKRIQQFRSRIAERIIVESVPFEAEYCLSKDPVRYDDRLSGAYVPISEGQKWGANWESAWFHLKGTVPAGWQGKTVAARVCLDGEALIFDESGCPAYGLTSGSVFDAHYNKDIYRLFDSCQGGEEVDLWIEAAANMLFGITPENNANSRPAGDDPKRFGHKECTANTMRLCVFDDALWQLWLDLEVLLSLVERLPENSPRRKRVLRGLCKMTELYKDNPANAQACRDSLKGLWTPPNHSDLAVTGVGHAHIDTGWLWPVSETVRKCARTFASQLSLIERYPGYVFGASQPQHYQFVKEYYPALYEKIRKAVSEGSWELQGGMWVEADCNVISGESMVRQFIHGKNFFMDEFGQDVTNLWLPDVFGYSAAMPQILQRAGVDFFLTQKISWSQYNKFPFHLFSWRGIDGTEVVTHFLPEDTYNAEVLPRTLGHGQDQFNESDICDEFVSLFGIGNGGGGPKEEYVERGLRATALEGCPKWRFGKAQDVFERMKQLAPELPEWSGELYLELHRGTLTTQALTKKYNRLVENKLRAVEYLWSCLPLADYPAEKLDRSWKQLLQNQFHDIIPGSSITRVYEVAHREYEAMLADCETLLAEAAGRLLAEDGEALTLVNPLSTASAAPVALPGGWAGCELLDADGAAVATQVEDGVSVALVEVPANGAVTLRKGAADTAPRATTNGLVLENDLVRYEFGQDGTLVHGFDKQAGRDVLDAPGNVLSLYDDRPSDWDAWDVDIFYEEQLLETARATGVTALAAGPVRSGLRFEMLVGQSAIVQTVTLAANSKKLDFATTVDWKECRRMLRVAFPVAVRSIEATCDIQYGFVKRPTHRNTSWDMAKFEICAHKYMDLSDNGYGVALLNDCKYGHKVLGNTLDLNLLRSPIYPDVDADVRTHTFVYSLLPHGGTLVESDVIEQAQMMNNPPLVFEGLAGDGVAPPCTLAGDEGVSLEVVKKAEKEDCHIIRLVETRGRTSTAVLTVANPAATLVETNLMEWTEEESESCAEPIALALAPFEIRTYKIK